MTLRPIRTLLVALVALSLEPAAAVAQGTIEYYHLDAIGNVRVVTDAAGTVLERHDYLPFGEECTTAPCAPAGTGARKFTGKERDVESGLDYFGARYYGSRIARFTTTDPFLDQAAALVDPQRWNRYAYARNNPFRYADPDGRTIVTYFGGLATAFGSNLTGGLVPRPTDGDSDFQFGQVVGDALSLIASGYEASVGGGLVLGGGAATATIVGSEAGVPATIAGGLLVGHAAAVGNSALLHLSTNKTAAEMAQELAGRIGKNSVPFETPGTKGRIDLRGKGHFDKASGQEIATPHVQSRPKHVGPEGQVNLGPQSTKPASKADVRTAEKLVERKQQ